MPEINLPHDHNNGNCEKLIKQLERLDDFQTVADIFKQLSDRSRIRIFWILCHCEECVINLSALVNMTTPAVSHLLKQLKISGLIVSRREGKEVYYTAADTVQAKLCHELIEQVMACACPSKKPRKSSNRRNS